MISYGKSSDKKRIQERVLRAVFKSKSDTYSELLTRAGLPSLYQQRLQNIAIFMYKIKNRLVPTYITEIFNTTPKQYNLRNAQRFRTVHYGKHFYGILVPISETNWTKPIEKRLMLKVLKAVLRLKTYHT